MFNAVISGNLADAPVETKNPEFLKLRFGCTQKVKNRMGQEQEITTWCQGVVKTSAVASIRPRLVKGAYVVASAANPYFDTYTDRNGQPQSNLNMGFMHVLEVGKSPADGAGLAPHPSAPQPTPSQPVQSIPLAQPVTHQQPAAAESDDFVSPF